MGFILLVVIIIFIAETLENREEKSHWDKFRNNFDMSGYTDWDFEKMKEADDRDEVWSPVLSRKYERTMAKNLPEEIVQVYDVLGTVW
jgi:hypothetical protein